jgi:hypothetical protein
MATLPTIPTFASNDSSLTNLQELSYAVSFLSNANVRPFWHIYQSGGGEGLTSSAWSVVNFNTKAFDSDGVYDAPGVEIVTEGYYSLTACIPIIGLATTEGQVCSFKLTGGTNNPNLASGATFMHGYAGSASCTSASVDNALCLADISPICLYAGDLVQVQVWPAAGMTMDYNRNVSYEQGRWVPNFTGQWIRNGP